MNSFEMSDDSFAKLQASSRTEAVMRAVSLGLISADGLIDESSGGRMMQGRVNVRATGAGGTYRGQP